MKKINNIIIILLLYLPLCGWTRFYDFESGTSGQGIHLTGFNGNSDSLVQYTNTKAKNGSQSGRILYTTNNGCGDQNFGSGAYIEFPAVTISGEAQPTIWYSLWLYHGTSSDNPSGTNFSYTNSDPCNQRDAIKFLRFIKRLSNGSAKGMNSAMLRSSFIPWADLEFSKPSPPYPDVSGPDMFPHISTALRVGAWDHVQFMNKFSTTAQAQEKIWVNGVLILDRNERNMDDQTTVDSGWLFTTFNRGSPQNQYVYVDDVRISTDSSDPNMPGAGGGGGDTTPPSLLSSDPTDEETSVDINSNFSWRWIDSGDGIVSTTARLVIEGTSYSIGDMTTSGTDADMVFTFANSNLSTPLTTGQAVEWEMGLSDGTIQLTETGVCYTTPTADVTDVFYSAASLTTGTKANYTLRNSSIWENINNSGDIEMTINTTSYEGWAYARYSVTPYIYFDLTGTIRCDENLAGDDYIDCVWIVNYVDHDNFDFLQLNSTTSLNGWWERRNSTNTQISTFSNDLISDNTQHTTRLRNNNGTLEFYWDGSLIHSTTAIIVESSYIGFGSQNNGPWAYDDIVITDITPQPTQPGTGTRRLRFRWY